MLTLILAESAIETVPPDLWNHPSVRNHSKRRNKPTKFMILDRSYHHAAMKALKDNGKRGRPDIVHFSLLEALGSPLNKEGMLRIYVHTFTDHVISVAPETRLPRNYDRFIGLMEQLFEYNKAPLRGKSLLTLQQKTLPELLATIKPIHVIIFSIRGIPTLLEDVVSRHSACENLVAIVGGFPSGHFTVSNSSLTNDVVCIDKDMLEAWTVTSRLIYEYERAIALPRKRIESFQE